MFPSDLSGQEPPWPRGGNHATDAMIVTRYHRPKRSRKAARPVAIAGRREDHHTRRGRVEKPMAPDPEADARAAAFMARVIRRHG